jgi:hypothetical protein
MSIAQFVSSRATLASAALLSLALLVGCQSKPDASGATDVAGAGEQDGANTTQLSANPMPNIEGEMLRVGDRVHSSSIAMNSRRRRKPHCGNRRRSCSCIRRS